MSASNRAMQDGDTASYTGENPNPVEEQIEQVLVVEPRVTRNTSRGRRGRTGGRSGGRGGRPRNNTAVNTPTNDLSEQISRILMNTLPEILRQMSDSRREEEQERLSKEVEELRIHLSKENHKHEEELRAKLIEEAQKHEEDMRQIREEMNRLKSTNDGAQSSRPRAGTYNEFIGLKPPEFLGKCHPIAASN